MDENKNRSVSRHWVLTVSLVLVSVILVALLGWCWWGRSHDTPVGKVDLPTVSGPCEAGADNIAPAGFTFYENSDLGYRFAYPASWGSVAVITTAVGSETGNYVMGRFSANENAWFGGNAVNYTVNGRDGIPTDLPGYLKADSKFYTVGLWKFNTGTGVEDRTTLYPLAPPYEEKTGCNATALIRHWDASEVSTIGPATIAAFNLKPTNAYYGVNFVLNHPTTESSDQFDKLVRSFQLY